MKVTITLDFPDKRRAVIARWIAWISGTPPPDPTTLATRQQLIAHIRDAVRDRNDAAEYWDRGQGELLTAGLD